MVRTGDPLFVETVFSKLGNYQVVTFLYGFKFPVESSLWNFPRLLPTGCSDGPKLWEMLWWIKVVAFLEVCGTWDIWFKSHKSSLHCGLLASTQHYIHISTNMSAKNKMKNSYQAMHLSPSVCFSHPNISVSPYQNIAHCLKIGMVAGKTEQEGLPRKKLIKPN